MSSMYRRNCSCGSCCSGGISSTWCTSISNGRSLLCGCFLGTDLFSGEQLGNVQSDTRGLCSCYSSRRLTTTGSTDGFVWINVSSPGRARRRKRFGALRSVLTIGLMATLATPSPKSRRCRLGSPGSPLNLHLFAFLSFFPPFFFVI